LSHTNLFRLERRRRITCLGNLDQPVGQQKDSGVQS
jgi:hypothetical protein